MLLMPTTWKNWGRTERSTPVLSVAPRSVEQVMLAVMRARETGHSVKPIGASHSFSGIGATDGIRLRLHQLRGLVDVDLERSRVTLYAGTHLWELPALLNPLGLALANLGDVDRQTISGALSTGTHGTGLRLGGLATLVVGATLVTGTGELLTVSESEHVELLPAVALGLGALGVLVTVTLQCVPRFLLHAVEEPLPLDAALDSFEERCRANDHFEFYWFPHTHGVRAKTNTRLPITADRQPLGRVARFIDEEVMNNGLLGALVGFERFVPATTPAINRTIESVSSRRDYCDESHRVFITRRRVRFREMEYALPLAAVPEAVRALRTMIDERGYRVSFPIEVRAAAADTLWLSTAHGRESGYIAVHRYVHDADREYFREAEALLASFDGRPHWGKMHTLGADELRPRYAKFDDFLALRNRLDPDRVFRNDFLTRAIGA